MPGSHRCHVHAQEGLGGAWRFTNVIRPDRYGFVLGIVSWYGSRATIAHIVGRANHRARHSFGHIWQEGQSVITLLGEHKELTSTGMLAWGCFIMAQPSSPTYVSYVKFRLGNIGWGGRFVS